MIHLVSRVFSIPVSNAFIERVFSLATNQWTEERNLLLPETVKYLLLIKVNFDETCEEMYEFLLSKPKLLEKIGSGEKYDRNEA